MNDVKKTTPKKPTRTSGGAPDKTGSAATSSTSKDVKKKDALTPASKRTLPKKSMGTIGDITPSKAAKATPKRPKKSTVIAPDERHAMIAEAAYYRAEQRGFTGDPHTDWLEAEAEVDRLLNMR